ncbi:STAS domain-containing protein [Anaerosolibacter sp.]|uniref:STAS domain-containing protein n=1 Tax=Anaerosolibacter sp. TaxID=1872527 RepID=UPI0039EE576D
MENTINMHMNAVSIIIPKNFSVKEVGKLREEIYGMLDIGNKHFVMNFHDCEFIDSTGLGVLVGVYKKCMDNGGSLKIVGVQGNVKKVFLLTRLDKVFDIEHN